MADRHPFDDAFRERLKKLNLNQAAMAEAIGRSAGWYNKYIHGSGKATIDDVIRIAAVLVGATGVVVDADERRLLRVWRSVPAPIQGHAIDLFENVVKTLKEQQSKGSGSREGQTAKAAGRTARGTP